MSEENQSVEEVVAESTEQGAPISPDAGLIAESKKYRTRAQQAEAKLAEFQKKLEAQETAKLKEQEEWKTLAEQNEAKANDYAPYKEKYEALYNANKERLLNRFPEEQQEKFKDKDPEWLESLLEAQGKNNFTETTERASVPKNPENGGFSNTTEWAQKDPVGFTKYLENNVKGYIK